MKKTPSHTELRQALESELTDVLGKSERLENHLRNKDRTIPKDWSEMAQFVENDEVLEALEVRSRDRIVELTQAIERIDAGTYDRCRDCGVPISEERLSLIPTTAVCAECAA